MRPERLSGARKASRAACLALAVLMGAPAPARPADLTPQRQVESRLMCYCGCSDLTVRTCTCGTADGIRKEIGDRLERGESADAVVAAFVARHGEQIRSAPTKRGFDLLAWTTPFVALFAAGIVLVLLVRRWGAADPAPAPGARDGLPTRAPLTAAESEILRRVEREIRDGR